MGGNESRQKSEPAQFKNYQKTKSESPAKDPQKVRFADEETISNFKNSLKRLDEENESCSSIGKY